MGEPQVALEGLEGEPIEMTPELWDRMPEDFGRRHPESDPP